MSARRFMLIMLAGSALGAIAQAEPARPAASRIDQPIAAAALTAERQADTHDAAAIARATAAARKPADAKTRAAIKQTDLVSQARFWNDEFLKDSKDLEAGTALSDILRRIGSYERSVEIVQQILPSYPQDKQLWSNLGLALIGAGRNADAIGPLQRALALDPTNAPLASALGVAFDEVGQAEMARAAYQQALILAPDDPVTLTNLGFSWILAGDLKQAEHLLRKAAVNPAAPPQARQNLAMAVGLQGRFDEAQVIAARDVAPEQAAQNIAWLRSMVDQPNRWEALRNAPE